MPPTHAPEPRLVFATIKTRMAALIRRQVNDLDAEVLLEAFGEQRAMARRRGALHAEQRHHACLAAELLEKTPAVERAQVFLAISSHEQFAQFRALAFGDAIGLVGGVLAVAQLPAGCEV